MTRKETIEVIIALIMMLALGVMFSMSFNGYWHRRPELTPEQKREQLYEQCVRTSYINGRDIENCNKINKVYGDNNTISAS